MVTHRKPNNAAETARPERRASKRLAADLLRFEAAFEKLERGRMGIGALTEDDKDEDDLPQIPERDVQAYLSCLDEAIRQLADEFSADAAIADVIKQRDVVERDAMMPANAPRKAATALTVDEQLPEPVATPNAAIESATKACSPPRPNCVVARSGDRATSWFETRPCDAMPIGAMISQVDTSAV